MIMTTEEPPTELVEQQEPEQQTENKLEGKETSNIHFILCGIVVYLIVLVILGVSVLIERKIKGPRAEDTCGLVTEEVNNFVANGTAAPLGFVPWYVSLEIGPDLGSCGGSIISKDWFITSSHCFEDIPCFELDCYTVIAGSQFTKRVSPGTIHRIIRIEKPDKSKYKNKNYYMDIALARVHPPFEYRLATKTLRGISRVCLPSQDEPITEKECQVYGLGEYSFYFNFRSRQILTAKIGIESREECQYKYVRTRELEVLEKDLICTIDESDNPHTLCQGDSGGPVTVRRKNLATLIGIVSKAPMKCGFFMTFHTNVALYRNWIRTITNV